MDAPNNNRTSFIDQLAQRLGISASAASVYGEPVERGPLTVIPVAKARYGFGGGMGSKAGEEGSGGGGGVSVTPIGYIEIRDGQSQFRPIRDPQTLVKVIAVSGITTLLLVRALGKLGRR